MKSVYLMDGLYATMDLWAFELVSKLIKPGTRLRKTKARNRYYVEFTGVDGIKYSLHRFLLGLPATSIVVDHRDGNSLNNCYSNLRRFTYSKNMLNRRKFAGIKTTTKLHHICKRSTSYYVRVMKDGKRHEKGGFQSIESAIAYHKLLLPQLYPDCYQTIFQQNGYDDIKA